MNKLLPGLLLPNFFAYNNWYVDFPYINLDTPYDKFLSYILCFFVYTIVSLILVHTRAINVGELFLGAKTISGGFTLIELLVVIAIIAILAVMGFAAFRGFTTKGNDARRLADLKAISSALEANKTAAGYQLLADAQFASGKIPTSPTATTPYCVSASTTGTLGSKPTLAQLYNAGACNTTGAGGVGANGAAWNTVSTSNPTANTIIWMMCGVMEDGATINCKNHAQ